MIEIKETKHCDSRALNPGEKLTEEAVKHDTELHIEAVEKCGDFICEKIKSQFSEHDHTKLGEYLPAFTEALSSGFKGKEFKEQDWWEIHLKERHHLNDKVPDDVNLIDVLEMICDCCVAGMARTGEVYGLKISNEVLKKAFDNTSKMLLKEIKVVKGDMEKRDYKESLEFLAKDEEEAIKGYDEVIEELGENPIVEQLKKIRDEEKAHLDFLREAKDDKDAKYVDPSDSDGDDKYEERIKEIFGL